jgi:hypothetical protein
MQMRPLVSSLGLALAALALWPAGAQAQTYYRTYDPRTGSLTVGYAPAYQASPVYYYSPSSAAPAYSSPYYTWPYTFRRAHSIDVVVAMPYATGPVFYGPPPPASSLPFPFRSAHDLSSVSR